MTYFTHEGYNVFIISKVSGKFTQERQLNISDSEKKFFKIQHIQ